MPDPSSLASRSGLHREIDLSNPSNLAAVALALFSLGLCAGRGRGVLAAGAAAGWTFATWAYGREFDPDRPGVAVAAAAIMAPLAATVPTSALLLGPVATGAVMVHARALAGTTGRALLPADRVVLQVASTGCLLALFLSGRDRAPAWTRASTVSKAVGPALGPYYRPAGEDDLGRPLDPERVARARAAGTAAAATLALASPLAAAGLVAVGTLSALAVRRSG